MGLEDNLLNAVRTLRSAGESLIDIAKKVGEEVLKDNQPKPEEQKVPEGATAKTTSEDLPGWEQMPCSLLTENGLFRFSGKTYRVIGSALFPSIIVTADGRLKNAIRATCMDDGTDKTWHFDIECKVLAKKK